MPSFAYAAVDPRGRRLSGHADAVDRTALERSLEARGLLVLDVEAAERAETGQSFGAGSHRARVLELTRALAALLPAGLPLPRALGAAATMAGPELADTIKHVRQRVERGESFAAALADHPRTFPPIYVGLVRAGERSGDLAGAMTRLAEQLEREEALRARLLAALIYPTLLAVAGALSVAVLVLFVLPRFAEMLSGAGAALPGSTATLLALSAGARQWWPLVVATGGAAGACVAWARTTDGGRRAIASAALATPIVGPLRAHGLTARFARLLGVLLAGGAPLLHALDDTVESLDDPVARDDALRIRARVREGTSLTHAVAESPIFPPVFAQLVGVGEESGRLHPFLLKAAEIFEEKTDRSRQRLVAFAEPAMIVVFGGIVGFVALSLLQAIYGINAGAFK